MVQGLVEEKQTPPYCPAGNLIQVLKLMKKRSLSEIDRNLLSQYKIAPHGEYKVIGALKFLGLIDDQGRPTEMVQMLWTKKPSGIRQIIENSYPKKLVKLVTTRGPEEVYNYFLTKGEQTPEMARKATRVFLLLCRMAEMEIGGKSARHRKKIPTKSKKKRTQVVEITEIPPVSFVLAITPETAEIPIDDLANLFRKIRMALERSLNGGER